MLKVSCDIVAFYSLWTRNVATLFILMGYVDLRHLSHRINLTDVHMISEICRIHGF